MKLQDQVISQLDANYQWDTKTDFSALQNICDSSQDTAILALKQLQQRMLTVPETSTVSLNLTASPPISFGVSKPIPATREASSPSSNSSHDAVNGTHPSGPAPSKSSTLPSMASIPQASLRPGSSLSQTSTGSHDTAKRNADPYKPMATTVTKTGFFGIVRRTKVEPIINPPENPLVEEYLADALDGNAKRLSQTASIKTVHTLRNDPDHRVYGAWHDASPRPAESSLSFDSVFQPRSLNRLVSSNRSVNSIGVADLLPNEMNQYAGFCKGAWRQQNGDTSRAMEERVRPGGVYNQSKYWQCKHCKFEGRLVPIDKRKSGYDMRVFKLVDGIQFRWNFMFKSHIATGNADSNPTKATYGCIFCCSGGNGTPTFAGIQNFMDHLVKHREQLPTGEVLYRMNCLVGRQATIVEDFDINLVSLDESFT